MPAWTTGTALVTPSAIQLMPPVMAGLTLSSTLAPSLTNAASRLPVAPSMVLALVAASTAASVKPSDMIASLNSCAGDLPVGHRVAEVAGIGSGLLERLLDFAACTGDCVGELVPVFGRQFSLSGCLGQDHGDRLEGIGGAAGDGVQVAGGFGEPVVVGHAVGGELGGGVADVVEVVDGLVGIVLRAGGESFDPLLADAGEVQGAGELLGAVGGAGDLAGQAHERFDGLARDALRDAGDDAEFRAEAAGEAVAGFDAGGVAGGFRCAAERRFDGLADALHAGHDLHERGGDLDCHAMPPLMVVRGAARYAASCSSSIATASPPVASCRTVPGRWSCPRQRAPLREASLVFVQARNARLSRMSARR